MKKLVVGLVFSLSMSILAACSSTSTREMANETPAVSASSASNLSMDTNQMPEPANKPTFSEPQPVPVSNSVLAGDIQATMRAEDKSKLSHALDKALGKSTEWTNEVTGITYNVVPTKKVIVNDNHFCRKYTITATKNDESKEVSGTACVSEDGEWHAVN